MASWVGIKMNGKLLVLSAFMFFIFGIASFVSAQAVDPEVCCEKTNAGLYCQNVPESQCSPGSQKSPTSCESTSFCRIGTCYSGVEGTCTDSPQTVCNARNATWSPAAPAQCNLGCCTLGDQASFVSLVRCKRLASFLGISVNYNKGITNEAACILSVRNQDKGACVYEFEFEKTCKFTTRESCSSGINGTGGGTFYKDKLCTARDLGTVCSPTGNTACLPGKEEVYYIDSCGNPGNVYDSSKKSDLNYWNNIVKPENGCNPNDANINSKTCGNCNYMKGSICRAAAKSNKPTFGNNICTNLNCVDAKGKARRHGESWCEYDDAGGKNDGKNSVGSRYFKHVCENGQEVVENCADFRQEECIQDKITAPDGYEFQQAACRVNRWQDCLGQESKEDCENGDRRDCLWRIGLSPVSATAGTCLPKNPPGLQFWSGEEAKKQCAQANVKLNIVYEKGLFDKSGDCKQNCMGLDQEWINSRALMCNAMGDCGPNINWESASGRTAATGEQTGFKVNRAGFEADKGPNSATI